MEEDGEDKETHPVDGWYALPVCCHPTRCSIPIYIQLPFGPRALSSVNAVLPARYTTCLLARSPPDTTFYTFASSGCAFFQSRALMMLYMLYSCNTRNQSWNLSAIDAKRLTLSAKVPEHQASAPPEAVSRG